MLILISCRLPPEYSNHEQLTQVYDLLAQANFICQKSVALGFHESYFLYLIGVDPNLNSSLAYLPTRFLLLRAAFNACSNGGAVGDIEMAFLCAIHERANSKDLQIHEKQRAFFELWWNNPEFIVPRLKNSMIKTLAYVQKDINSFINKNSFKLGKEKLRHLKIVVRLINPVVLAPLTHTLAKPAFKLAFTRDKGQRVCIEQQAFSDIMAKLRNMECAAAIGEMFDKLGVTDVLMDGTS